MTSNPEQSRDSGFRAVPSEGDSSMTPFAGVDPVQRDQLAETVPGIVFSRIMDHDGSLTYPYFSPSLETYTGYAIHEVRVANNGSLDFIHWADRDTYLKRVLESARTGGRCHEEFRVIGPDGEVRWFRGSSVPRADDQGRVIWDGTLIDETDRKRAEHWLGMIMDHAADVIITITVDGVIERSNASSMAVFGRYPEDLIGQPISVLMPQLDKGNLTDVLRRYLITGKFTLDNAGPDELLGLNCNGKMFPIEVQLSEVLTEGRRLFIGVIRDISERKAAEAALMETQRRLAAIAENLQGLAFQRVLRSDGTLRYLYISGTILDLIGEPPEAIIQDAGRLLNVMPPDHRISFLKALENSAQTLSPMEDDYKLIGRDETEFWLRGWSYPRQVANGDVVWEGVALDVSDRKRAESRLIFLAYHDSLTGLGNRSLLIEKFGDLCDIISQDSAPTKRIALLSISLDRLGIINASLGHTDGDKVILYVSQRLLRHLAPTGLLYRAGGSRFLAVLPDCGTDADIRTQMSRLAALFQLPVEVSGHQHDVSVSIGASVWPNDSDDPETLIKHADAALHQAKVAGAGLHRLYTEEMGLRAANVLTMRHRMRLALEQNEFKAYFQPQLDLASNQIVGTEALARWIVKDGTQIQPGEFIPIAEEYGLIDEICLQVLQDSCRWTKRWNAIGLGPISVAVNISGRQFHNPATLTAIVDQSLDTLGLEPALLELELTESSAMNDPESASKVIRMFTDRGIGCSIDDFGTGYSSLSVLKQFALRKLKIDRCFVKDVTSNPNDAAICGAIVAMAHALKLKVCAEGVETIDQLDFLRGLSCDQVQGYLIARPLPPETLERFLNDMRSDKKKPWCE